MEETKIVEKGQRAVQKKSELAPKRREIVADGYRYKAAEAAYRDAQVKIKMEMRCGQDLCHTANECCTDEYEIAKCKNSYIITVQVWVWVLGIGYWVLGIGYWVLGMGIGVVGRVRVGRG